MCGGVVILKRIHSSLNVESLKLDICSKINCCILWKLGGWLGGWFNCDYIATLSWAELGNIYQSSQWKDHLLSCDTHFPVQHKLLSCNTCIMKNKSPAKKWRETWRSIAFIKAKTKTFQPYLEICQQPNIFILLLLAVQHSLLSTFLNFRFIRKFSESLQNINIPPYETSIPVLSQPTPYLMYPMILLIYYSIMMTTIPS